MTPGRRALALAGLVLGVGFIASTGCSKDEAKKGPTTVSMSGGWVRPAPNPAAVEGESTDNPRPTRAIAGHTVIEAQDAGPLTYSVKARVDAGPPPKEDPDLAVIAYGRSAGAACFTGITDGSPTRSASIQVTVVPSGRVNRADVTTRSTEPWVVSCLENVGNGLHFSDRPAADIRSYAINISVTRNP